MIIKRVKLTNYAQHKSLDIKVTESFVGILGSNGSGKSNFLNSISDAITGEFHKKKSRIISFGEKDGSVEVEAEVDGQSFSVYRSLGATTCHMLIGSERLDGADLVNSRILSLMECDKPFLQNMVFVGQEDILGILFGRPAERNKLLQRFFGLEKAQRIELALGSWVSNLSQIDVASKKRVEEEYNKAKEDLRDATERVKAAREDSAEKSAMVDKSSSNYSRYEKILALMKKAQERERLEERLAMVSEEIGATIEHLGEKKKHLIDEKWFASINGEREALEVSIERNTAVLDVISPAVEKLGASSDHRCPVCSSDLDPMAIEHIKASVKELKIKIKSDESAMEEVCAKIDKAALTQRRVSRDVDMLQAKLDSLTEERDSVEAKIGTCTTKKGSVEYEKIVKAFEEAVDAARESRRRLEVEESGLAMIQKSVESYASLLGEMEEAEREALAIQKHKRRMSRIQQIFKHNGAATTAYMKAKMSQMCDAINAYLAGFSSEFTVTIGTDNEFLCRFPNKKISSTDLSGGQKVVLSLAFRFASCELFTSKVALITLDEPTTWLDAARKESFPEIFDEVKSMATRQNRQVLTVTHERYLTPCFDQVIEF